MLRSSCLLLYHAFSCHRKTHSHGFHLIQFWCFPQWIWMDFEMGELNWIALRLTGCRLTSLHSTYSLLRFPPGHKVNAKEWQRVCDSFMGMYCHCSTAETQPSVKQHVLELPQEVTQHWEIIFGSLRMRMTQPDNGMAVTSAYMKRNYRHCDLRYNSRWYLAVYQSIRVLQLFYHSRIPPIRFGRSLGESEQNVYSS